MSVASFASASNRNHNNKEPVRCDGERAWRLPVTALDDGTVFAMVTRKNRREIVRTRSHPRLCSGANALLHHRGPRLSSTTTAAAVRAATAAGSAAQQHRIQLRRLEVIVEAADGEQHGRVWFGCGREMLLRLKRMMMMRRMLVRAHNPVYYRASLRKSRPHRKAIHTLYR